MRIRRKTIDHVANSLLRKNHVVQAPVPVERIAAKLGLEVQLTSADDSLSGFILRNAETNVAIIGVNNCHSRNRQRFTIAHEIGHFLLHEGEPVHVDASQSFRVDRRSTQSTISDKRVEIEANAFAAALLMPADILRADLDADGEMVELSDDKAIKSLADKYQVSVTAMTFRLANLGYISL